MRRPGPMLLLAGAVLAVPVCARADAGPDPAKVRAAAEEFDAGRRAFKLRDFEGAALHFENADRDAPNPEALRSAIRARKEAKQLARAATLASLAQIRYPDEATLQALAGQVIAQAERAIGRVEVTCQPACSLLIDGKLTPFAEVEVATAWLDPGAHEVVAAWSEKRSQAAPADIVPGASVPLDFKAPALPAKPAEDEEEPVRKRKAPPPPPPPEPQTHAGLSPTLFFFGVGGTVVLGGITAWSGADTVANPGQDRVRQECAGKGEDCPAYQDGRSRQTRTNVLLATTGVVGVATAVVGLFFTDWKSTASSSASAPRVLPTVAVSDGVTLGAVGTF